MTDVELYSRQVWKKISFRTPASCFFVFQVRQKEKNCRKNGLFCS